MDEIVLIARPNYRKLSKYPVVRDIMRRARDTLPESDPSGFFTAVISPW